MCQNRCKWLLNFKIDEWASLMNYSAALFPKILYSFNGQNGCSIKRRRIFIFFLIRYFYFSTTTQDFMNCEKNNKILKVLYHWKTWKQNIKISIKILLNCWKLTKFWFLLSRQNRSFADELSKGSNFQKKCWKYFKKIFISSVGNSKIFGLWCLMR